MTENDADVWEVRVGLLATREEAENVKERIQQLLCPDPDHAPPCPIPWTTSLLQPDDPADYEFLVEQARIERPLRG